MSRGSSYPLGGYYRLDTHAHFGWLTHFGHLNSFLPPNSVMSQATSSRSIPYSGLNILFQLIVLQLWGLGNVDLIPAYHHPEILRIPPVKQEASPSSEARRESLKQNMGWVPQEKHCMSLSSLRYGRTFIIPSISIFLLNMYNYFLSFINVLLSWNVNYLRETRGIMRLFLTTTRNS